MREEKTGEKGGGKGRAEREGKERERWRRRKRGEKERGIEEVKMQAENIGRVRKEIK